MVIWCPFGRVSEIGLICLYVVNEDKEWVMWSVAPVSTIHSSDLDKQESENRLPDR